MQYSVLAEQDIETKIITGTFKFYGTYHEIIQFSSVLYQYSNYLASQKPMNPPLAKIKEETTDEEECPLEFCKIEFVMELNDEFISGLISTLHTIADYSVTYKGLMENIERQLKKRGNK